jgi:hypothetical protein
MPLSQPNPAVCWERREPGCRPGERLVDGRPYVFNADSLNRWLAEEAVATAPVDLSVLTGPQLASLDYRCTRRLTEAGGADPQALLLHDRVAAERRRRGLDAPFNPAVSAI